MRIRKLNFRRITIVIGIFVIATWLLSTVALFCFIKYAKEYSEIRYSDVVFPWKWNDMRPRWGNHFVEKATELAEQGQWDKAYHFARIGVSKAPDNLEGRLLLANILFQANLLDRAVDVLESGIPYSAEKEPYWKRLIEILQYHQADLQVISIIQKGLQEKSIPEPQINRAIAALARAQYNQANYDQALEIIKEYPTLKNTILRTQIYFDTGLEKLAIAELEALDQQHSNNKDIIPLLTLFYLKSGFNDKGRQLAQDSYYKNPYSVEATLNFLGTLEEQKQVKLEIHHFIERAPELFQSDQALFQFFNFLSETGRTSLLTELLSKTPIHIQDSSIVWFITVESKVNAGQYSEALISLESPPPSVNMNLPLNKTLYQSLKLSTLSGLGQIETAETALQELLGQTHIRPATLLQLSKKLNKLNNPIVAEKIIQFLLRQNPGNHPAKVLLIQASNRLGDQEQALRISQSMLDKKTLPFEIKEELISSYSSDYTLRGSQEKAMVQNILDSLTPSRKREILSRL